MHHFDLKDGALHAEGVPLELIADEVGTPAYVYSTATLKRHYGLLRAAADAHRDALGEALIAFAVKANSNLSVLATLAKLGSGADTVSEGEIRRALAAGVPADRIIFSGVGKTDVEMAFAISVGVRQINIESGAELERLIAVAAMMDAAPPIAIRVNPNVGAGGHAKITTGGKGDKFGVPVEEAMDLYARASASPHVTPVGLACHIGSQITDLAPLEAAFTVLGEMTPGAAGAGSCGDATGFGRGAGRALFGRRRTAFASPLCRHGRPSAERPGRRGGVRAGPAAGRQCGRAAEPGDPGQRTLGRAPVPGAGRGDERPDAAGAV